MQEIPKIQRLLVLNMFPLTFSDLFCLIALHYKRIDWRSWLFSHRPRPSWLGKVDKTTHYASATHYTLGANTCEQLRNTRAEMGPSLLYVEFIQFLQWTGNPRPPELRTFLIIPLNKCFFELKIPDCFRDLLGDHFARVESSRDQHQTMFIPHLRGATPLETNIW